MGLRGTKCVVGGICRCGGAGVVRLRAAQGLSPGWGGYTASAAGFGDGGEVGNAAGGGRVGVGVGCRIEGVMLPTLYR